MQTWVLVVLRFGTNAQNGLGRPNSGPRIAVGSAKQISLTARATRAAPAKCRHRTDAAGSQRKWHCCGQFTVRSPVQTRSQPCHRSLGSDYELQTSPSLSSDVAFRAESGLGCNDEAWVVPHRISKEISGSALSRPSSARAKAAVIGLSFRLGYGPLGASEIVHGKREIRHQERARRHVDSFRCLHRTALRTGRFGALSIVDRTGSQFG